MKVLNKSLFLLPWLLTITTAPRTDAPVLGANPQSPQVAFRSQILLLRNLQQQLEAQEPGIPRRDSEGERLQQEQRQALAIKLLQKLKTVSLKPHSLGANFFRYYQARLQALAGETNIARKTFVDLAGQETTAPEAGDALYELDEMTAKSTVAGGDRRKRYWSVLGQLLPTSTYGDFVKGIGMQATGRHHTPLIPRVMPGRTDHNLVEISRLFFDMKMYQQACAVGTEAAYATFPPPRINYWLWQSWLSNVTAPIWLQVAQSHWQLGNPSQAADYLAKAIVFGSTDTAQAALTVHAQWQKTAPPKAVPDAEPDLAKLKRIIHLYANMNMHPRALELVKQYRELLGAEAEPLQQRLEKEWLELLEAYCGSAKKCLFYGQQITDAQSKLNATFAPSLTKEALAEASKTMRELVKP